MEGYYICHSCGIEKPLSDYYKDNNSARGHVNQCKKCRNEYRNKWRNKNLEREKAKDRKRDENNPHYAWARSSIQMHRKSFDVRFTQKELVEFVKPYKECSLCNTKLNWNYGTKEGRVWSDSPTLDRINNETILSLDNIAIICHRCNTTKGNRTMKEFIDYCKLIVERLDVN